MCIRDRILTVAQADKGFKASGLPQAVGAFGRFERRIAQAISVSVDHVMEHEAVSIASHED